MSNVSVCSYCNTSNPPDTRFCTHCGVALPGGSGQIQPGRVMAAKYTVLRPLGKGGMGAIYLASQTIASRERQVVIKEMLDYYDPRDPEAADRAHQRFEAEAATLTSLNYANIPLILDYFEENKRCYIVMQYVQGQNLETGLTHEDDDGKLIQGQPYPVDQVLRWGVRLCKVLDYLASQNVVHMDIKPANLILDPSGDVWLVDYGTAKAQRVVQPAGPSGLQKSSIYGTLGYAPAEQTAGKAEPRSDVYALAATLYHLMTDDDPRNQPYVFSRMDQLPPEIAAVLRRALAHEVSQRPTAAEFGQALQAPPAVQPLPSLGTPFQWQDGTQVFEPKDLVRESNPRWEEARQYFSQGQWEYWFKTRSQTDVLAQLKSIKSRVQNPDLALDTFLRFLDPSLPKPVLDVSPGILDAGILPWQTRLDLELEVVNRGKGCLQVRFVDLPTGVKVSPTEGTVQSRRAFKVTVDAGDLTPSSRPYTLNLTVDGGPSGKKKVPLKVTVPEPRLQVAPQRLDLGSTVQGEPAVASLTIANTGRSAFVGEVVTPAPWVTVEPARFLCLPEKSYSLKITGDSGRLKAGPHTAPLSVRANVAGWRSTADVQVRVNVTRHISRVVVPPVVWIVLWIIYGVSLGSILAAWAGRTPGLLGWAGEAAISLQEPGKAGLVGALLGLFVNVLPASAIGLFGGIGGRRGMQGLQAGALLGAIPGLTTGGFVGAFFENIVPALSGTSEGQLVILFGLMVGGAAGLTLGALLWLMPQQR